MLLVWIEIPYRSPILESLQNLVPLYAFSGALHIDQTTLPLIGQTTAIGDLRDTNPSARALDAH